MIIRQNININDSKLPTTKETSKTALPSPLLIADLLWQVGNEFIRGISGGERKRTNIGMELIMSPSVLFLDEPTTGLDASTAVSVIQLLQG